MSTPTLIPRVLDSQTLRYPLDSELRYKVYLDLAFQSSARWSEVQKVAFMFNLVCGLAPSKLILANIKTCLEYCIETYGEDSDEAEYLRNIPEQFEYISIDGNNRTITIDEFMNDEFALPNATYNVIVPGDEVPSSFILTNENNVYSKLPEGFKQYIQALKITLEVYLNATRKDLSNIFIATNDGVALNKQEKRNAKLVPIAGVVRELANASPDFGKGYTFVYDNMLKYVFRTDKNVKRRVTDDFVLTMFLFIQYGTQATIQDALKEKAYAEESDFTPKTLQKCEEIVIDFTTTFKDCFDSNMTEISSMMNLFMAYNDMLKKNVKIHDAKAFYEYFLAVENELRGDTKDVLTLEGGETRTFDRCCATMSKDSLEFRHDKLIGALDYSYENGVALRDSDRIFTKEQRFEMWEKQDGVCPETGKTIPKHEINNSQIWHADHIIPWDAGGQTIVENGQLICKIANLKKSNKVEVL